MRTERLMIAASGLTIALCGAVWAGGTESCPGSPGWNYGGGTCGCLGNVNADRNSCMKCCEAMPAGAGNQYCCEAFCLQAVFPCLPRNGL